MNKSPEFITKIHAFIEHNHLVLPNSIIIVGLSGGPDSLFLLHLLHSYQQQQNVTIIAAHLDHQWRTNSAQDVLFCKKACDELGITFVHATADQLPKAIQQHGSKEEIGRRMRRYFLQKVREDYSADAIALGHHMQDQEETFFIRLIRGTTLTGLTGMKPQEDSYIRPLLETNKKDIVAYLTQQNIKFLTDPSNSSESFLRNRIRIHVIPALQTCDKRFTNNFLRTLKNLQKAESYLKLQTTLIFSALAKKHDNIWYIYTKILKNIDHYMQNRLLLHWLITEQASFIPSENFLEEIKRFLYRPAGKAHQLHKNWSIVKQKSIVHIKKDKRK